MRLTKYTHACVRLDNDGTALVIDPGVYTEAEALAGAHAVLVTHEHPDHIDVAKVRNAAALARTANRELRVWAPAPVARELADIGDRVVTVAAGDAFDAAGFQVRAYGGQHAFNHPDLPVVPNVAYLVNGAVYHPGDSFALPYTEVDTLLVPTSGPWLKTAESILFIRAVRPRQAYSIHDALLSELGRTVVGNNLNVNPAAPFRFLAPGEHAEL